MLGKVVITREMTHGHHKIMVNRATFLIKIKVPKQ